MCVLKTIDCSLFLKSSTYFCYTTLAPQHVTVLNLKHMYDSFVPIAEHVLFDKC
jgi:hypothetical protein